MAEIQDTLGLKPKLETYQARPITYKDPKQSKALNIDSVDAEMWNSVSKNLEKVFKINNDTKIAALDLEKDKIGTQIADHYRKQETYVLENINTFKDSELNTEEFFKKYDEEDDFAIKKFEYGKGHTNESKEQMEAIKNDAEGRSRARIRQLLHQELVKRTGDMLDNKANRSINILRNGLINSEITFDESKMGETFGDAMLIRGKNQQAESLMKEYKKVLTDKAIPYGNMMDEEEKERRIYEYSQQLGHVLFEHYVKIDPEKAIEYARNREFTVGNIKLDSKIVGDYLINEEKRKRTEVERGKKAEYESRIKLQSSRNPASYIHMYFTESKKEVRIGGEMNERGMLVGGKTIAKVFHDLREPTREEFKVARDNGFSTKESYRTALRIGLLNALGKQDQAVNLAKAEKKVLDRENFKNVKTAITAYIDADNKNIQDIALGQNYDKEEFGKGNYIWRVKDSYVDKITKKYDLQREIVERELQELVKGVRVRAPGSGMGQKDFGIFQSALIDHYTKKLFVKTSGVMSADPSTQKDIYRTDLMNDKERGIYQNIVRGFEGIINFNTDNFTSKSSSTLLTQWAELEKENVNYDTGQKSLAWAMVADRYKGTILARRVENLVLRPNETARQDLKIPDRDFSRVAITEDEMGKIDKWYQKLGQDRSLHKGGRPGEFVYIPEHYLQNLKDQIASPLKAELSKAEQMKREYKE